MSNEIQVAQQELIEDFEMFEGYEAKIETEELIDGVEEGGVALYLDKASQGNISLFI